MSLEDAASSGLPAADPAGSAAIDVAHLVKLYKTTRAVDDVTFRIAPGSITGLLGGNGAGKTTTIAMIMGLVLPTSGRIRVLGASIPGQSADVLGRMNFESPYVDMPMRLTVRQNLTIFGRLYAVENLPDRIDELAAELDLSEFLDRAIAFARQVGALIVFDAAYAPLNFAGRPLSILSRPGGRGRGACRCPSCRAGRCPRPGCGWLRHRRRRCPG